MRDLCVNESGEMDANMLARFRTCTRMDTVNLDTQLEPLLKDSLIKAEAYWYQQCQSQIAPSQNYRRSVSLPDALGQRASTEILSQLDFA